MLPAVQQRALTADVRRGETPTTAMETEHLQLVPMQRGMAHCKADDASFKIQDKWMRCLLTYQSGLWLPGSPSIHWFLPVTESFWFAYPHPTLNSPAQELGSPFLQFFWPL